VVARALVGGGFDLLGLHQTGLSLEEIFLQLTKTDAAAEPNVVPTAAHEVSA
jgi:hypothetical protein